MSNVGAFIGKGENAKRPASKTAVRNAVRKTPDLVTFDVTDMMGPQAGQTYTVETLPEGVTFYLCGPDPYNSRKFYGQVTRGAKGVTVK